MPNEMILQPDQLSVVTELGGVIATGAEITLDAPELRRIFGETLTGRLLILDLTEVRQGLLISWTG